MLSSIKIYLSAQLKCQTILPRSGVCKNLILFILTTKLQTTLHNLTSGFGSCFLKIKEEGKDQISIQSCTTPDPGHIMESDKNTESQEVSPFPAGDHKAARNRRDSRSEANTIAKLANCN